jgi:hypothetical protein
MRYFIILLQVLLMVNLLPVALSAQENQKISDARKANVMKLMDYRFKGGYYSFEKLAYKNLKYPELSESVCVVGIALVEIQVDCQGEIKSIKVKNPLRYGIDEDISKFIESTGGMWNKCNDDKYTKVEIPIQYVMDGLVTNNEDAMIVIHGKNPGVVCNDDSYYLEKAQKYLEKGNGKKAMGFIDILIVRNPYTNDYYEMKKKALALTK